MVQDLLQARLVLVGETHDDESHHRLQLLVIQALVARGARLAVATEVFSAQSQNQLDLWNGGILDDLAFRWLYEDNWSEPWPLYRDVFLYARNHSVPLIGLNYDKELVRKLSSGGIDALSPEERKLLPPDISCDLNTPYTRFLEGVYKSHPGRARTFADFCTVQTLWNRGMAQRLSDYLLRHPERTVVALVGTYHAVKGGIPAGNFPWGYRVVVPEAAGSLTARDADYTYR